MGVRCDLTLWWGGALAGSLLLLGACGLERPPGEARRTRAFAAAAGTASLDAGPLRYRGGAVLSAAEITVVFWGDDVTPQLRSETETLYRTLTEVDDFDWITEYDTPSQQIGRARLGGTVLIHTPDAGRVVQQEDLEAELVEQIDAGALPPPGENSYYAVYLPVGVKALAGPFLDSGCRVWDAYHAFVVSSGVAGAYALFPDCGQRSDTAVHELFEAVTDPYLDGWYDDDGLEVADLCRRSLVSLSLADGGALSIQRLWSNRAGACLASQHEFQVVVAPANHTAAPTLTFEISATEPLKRSGPVSFTVIGLPAGVTASLVPGSAASSPWTLTLNLTAPFQTFPFKVEGRSDRWNAAATGYVFAPQANAPTAPAAKASETGCSQAGGVPGTVALPLAVLVLLGVRRRRPIH